MNPVSTRFLTQPAVCLQGNLTAAAEELIVHTYFFSASREILPQVGRSGPVPLSGSGLSNVSWTAVLRQRFPAEADSETQPPKEVSYWSNYYHRAPTRFNRPVPRQPLVTRSVETNRLWCVWLFGQWLTADCVSGSDSDVSTSCAAFEGRDILHL